MVWYRVTFQERTYAIICAGGKVISAPPDVVWMLGKKWTEVQDQLQQEGAKIIKLT